ncbi:hypothetical protein [Priestia megaterium]|uniref:hypothetical protein n=1 Tax=Priestia megaterium TaxID=1404 RepID=UPI0031FBE6BE
MIHIPTLKRRIKSFLIFCFFVYASIYGTLSIFLDNLVVRSLKDVALIGFVFISVIWMIFNKKIPLTYLNLLILSSVTAITVISLLSILNGNALVTLVYGVKITIFPLSCLFFGIFLKNMKYDMHRVLIVIYVLMIVAWLIEAKLGVDKLVSMGFEYAVNVKNFADGAPRYPSIVGFPNSYAFLLALVGLLLESSFIGKNKRKIAFVVKVLTFIFLILSTMRSALLLFLFCQAFTYFRQINIAKGRKKHLLYSMVMFCLAIIPVGFYFLIKDNASLLNLNSLHDRLGHWLSNLPAAGSLESFIGLGLGTVGGASRRIAELGYVSKDYPVDNQYISFYEQVGLLGIIAFSCLLFSVIFQLHSYSKNITNLDESNIRELRITTSLVVATLFSSLFTNLLEIYPYNVFLFTYIGMQLHPYFHRKEGIVPIQTKNVA